MKEAVLSILILMLIASVADAENLESQFRLELKKAEDSASITVILDSAVASIVSKSGIGAARLFRIAAEWPSRLVIRFNVAGLESFQMDNGDISFTTSHNCSGQAAYWKVGKRESGVNSPDGMLKVALTLATESAEIVVPHELMVGNPQEIRFMWIDFFRD